MRRNSYLWVLVVSFVVGGLLTSCASSPAAAPNEPAPKAAQWQEYDSEVVKEAMGRLLRALQRINPSLNSSDFAAAATAFGEIAATANSIQAMPSPDGDQATWTSTLQDLEKAALDGKAASEAGDTDGARSAFQRVIAAQQKGHGTFR